MTIKTSQTIWRLPGLGVREATLVIAAFDSSPQSKAQADDVCTGIDDQIKIQKAIDALPTGGGKVLLAEGTFYVRATTFLRPNTTLAGLGPSTIVKVPDGTVGPGVIFIVFDARNSPHVRFENFTIDGNEPGQPGAWPLLINLRNSPHFHIEGMYLLNSYTAIEPELGSSWGTIADNHFRNQAFGDSIGPFEVDHLQIIGNVLDGTSEGIDLHGVSNSVVQGNVIRYHWRGIEVRESPAKRALNNTITGNTITGPGVTVVDNYGIFVREGALFNIVSDNTIRDADLAIMVEGEANTISGNLIQHAVRGIFVRPGSRRIEISGNYIVITLREGIVITDTVNDIRIVNNNFLNAAIEAHHGWIGINLGNSINSLVEGNRFYSTHPHKMHAAIDGSASTRALIRGNLLRDLGALHLIQPAPDTTFTEARTKSLPNVLTASPTHVHPAITPDGLAHTDVTSPDVPRNTVVRITNTATTAQTPSGGNIVIEGVDARGKTTSETLVVPATSIPAGGTLDVFGSRAFATVSKITYYTETNTAITVSVGIANRIGLPVHSSNFDSVFQVARNGIAETVGAVDLVNGTVDLGAITAGDGFLIHYRVNLNVIR